MEIEVRSTSEIFASAWTMCYNDVLYSSNDQGINWETVAGIQRSEGDWGYSIAYGISLQAFTSSLVDAAGRMLLPAGSVIFSQP